MCTYRVVALVGLIVYMGGGAALRMGGGNDRIKPWHMV